MPEGGDKGQDWLLVDQFDDQHAHLRFTGHFQGRVVVWDCEFFTLAAVQARRNFIDVGLPDTSGMRLRVGLSIPRIDTPAIECDNLFGKQRIKVGAGKKISIDLPSVNTNDPRLPVVFETNDVLGVVLFAVSNEFEAGVSQIHKQTFVPVPFVHIKVWPIVLSRRAEVAHAHAVSAHGKLLMNFDRCRHR